MSSLHHWAVTAVTTLLLRSGAVTVAQNFPPRGQRAAETQYRSGAERHALAFLMERGRWALAGATAHGVVLPYLDHDLDPWSR